MKGTVAAGHPLTAKAACEILEKGGNAFDAVLAAGFASVVAEPALTSLGGGGFLLVHKNDEKQDMLIDFFVNTPGLGSEKISIPPLIPVEVRFKSSAQTFYFGIGSVAVPGTLKGFVHCYERFCSMDIDDILKPALCSLESGVEVTGSMEYLMQMLKPIHCFTDYGKEVFDKARGQRIYNPLLREFLSSRDPRKWVETLYATTPLDLRDELEEGASHLNPGDMKAYQVIERKPFDMQYKDFEIVTNPPPSLGGLLLALSLVLLKEVKIGNLKEDERAYLLVSLMEIMRSLRSEESLYRNGLQFLQGQKVRGSIDTIRNIIKGLPARATKGTTHISIIDGKGNAASMTASNGTGSGCFFGDTGIMLNNMMGEDELHPDGFYSLPPGQRVSSMMTPSFIKKRGDIFAVLGSGGSKRIVTALLQVIVNLTELDMDVVQAVESPRIHLDDENILQVEPGFSPSTCETLKKHFALNIWEQKDMYFGGVNTVMHDLTGYGDLRREGVCTTVLS